MIRIKFRDIEVEAQTLDQLEKVIIEKLPKLIPALAKLDAANRTKSNNVSATVSGAGVTIPTDNERLRRTKAELAIDEERIEQGLQPFSREEIIAQRRLANASPATGEKFGGNINLDEVPE